jgi:hypothetical protein
MNDYYIVELEPYVWLAPWDGDPGRTTVKENAQVFLFRHNAERALKLARMYRAFPDAVVRVKKAEVGE